MTGISTTSIDLQPMRWWHVDAVAALELRLFPHDAWSAEQFWQELAQPTRRYAVATRSGVVVGYAGVFVLPPDSDLQTIAVDPDEQGRGIGRMLLAWALDVAGRSGGTHMLLEVRADNAPAIALYRTAGFERISVRHRYYPDGGDADIMRLRLADAA